MDFDFQRLIPLLATLVGAGAVILVARWLLERSAKRGEGGRLRQQIILIALGGAGLLGVVISLPIDPGTRGDLLGIIGILLSAAVALSSTTLLGNALAGAMLHVVRSFRIGDFIRVNDHFGRVSERGLFHTEVQTRDRDLVTLPNLYLVTHPVTTIRSSGTIVSADISLGYDVSRHRIEECLLAAARTVDLQDPFVRVTELGDFSVGYRVAGMLTEVKQLLTVSSRLRAGILDEVHEAGIEIVSPNFMNTRSLAPDQPMIPKPERVAQAEPGTDAENAAFDKADEAESIESLKVRVAETRQEMQALEKNLKAIPKGAERDEAGEQLAKLATREQRLTELLERKSG